MWSGPPDIVVSQEYVYASHYTCCTCKRQPRASGVQRLGRKPTMHTLATSFCWCFAIALQVSRTITFHTYHTSYWYVTYTYHQYSWKTLSETDHHVANTLSQWYSYNPRIRNRFKVTNSLKRVPPGSHLNRAETHNTKLYSCESTNRACR